MSRLWPRACPLLVAAPLAAALATNAAALDVNGIFPNLGFENGNLSGWTLTLPNADYVSSLSPPVNPSIDPADPSNSPVTLIAPAGSDFVGLKRVGDVGPDLKYKLAHDAVAINVPTGTTFEVKIWANRGRLEPYDTPVSTADVLVRIFGWTAGAVPTVTASTDDWSRTIAWNPAAQSFDFTAVADGAWGQQILTFDPASAGIDAATLKYLSVSVAGRTNNHDQYIATDAGDAPTPTREATWGRLKTLYRE